LFALYPRPNPAKRDSFSNIKKVLKQNGYESRLSGSRGLIASKNERLIVVKDTITITFTYYVFIMTVKENPTPFSERK